MTPPDPDRHPQRYFGLGVLLLVAGLAVAGWPTLVLAPLGLALCVVSSYSRRHGWLLLGPLAGWELTRAARRGRMHAFRVVLVLAALFYLSTVYAQFVPGPWHRVFTAPGVTLTPSKAARASGQAFAAFGVATALFLAASAVFGLSPVVAEERERKRLDDLLVTDLRGREIVLGKMIGRLAVTAGYVVLVVPVLALLTVIGGVGAEDAVVFGAMALLTLVGLTGCALYAAGEVSAVKPAQAIAACFGALFMFGFGTIALRGLADILTNSWAYPPVTDWLAAPFRFLSEANPIFALNDLTLNRGGPTARDPVTVLCHFAAGQVLVFAAGLGAAVQGLRAEPKPTTAAKANKPVRVWPTKPRPAMTDEPVRWMEVEYNTARAVIYTGWRRTLLRVVGGAAAVALVAAVGAVLVVGWFVPRGREEIAPFFACAGGFAFVGVTLPTAWIASRGVARERENGTLEALRLTGLTPAEILDEKWHAARDLTRPLVYVILFGVGVGVVGTAMPVWVAAALAGLMYANWCVAASVGVAVSVASRKATHATARLFAVGFLCVALGLFAPATRNLHPRAAVVGFAVNPPIAGALSGALTALPAERGSTYPSLGWLAAAAVVAAGSSYLWSTLAWRVAVRRFTRDLTPAPDGTERPT